MRLKYFDFQLAQIEGILISYLHKREPEKVKQRTVSSESGADVR